MIKVTEENDELIKIYLTNKGSLSVSSLKQYKTSIYSFADFLYRKRQKKSFKEVNREDVILYQCYLFDRKRLKRNSILLKRSVIYNFYSFLAENIDKKTYQPIYDSLYKIELPSKKNILKKNENITKQEYQKLYKHLKNKETKQLQLLYLVLQYENNLKLKELQNLKKDIICLLPDRQGIYNAYIEGRENPIVINSKTMNLIKSIVEKRNDNNEFLFTIKDTNHKVNQIHFTTFQYWVKDPFSKIVKRPLKTSMMNKIEN